MHFRRNISIVLLFLFLSNVIIPYHPVKADPVIPEGWVRYNNTICGFSIYLPEESVIATEYKTEMYVWISLPILNENANLSEKFVEIECSFDPASRNVGTPNSSPPTEKVFNDIPFIVQSGAEGAAGNLYQAIKYSAERNGQFAVLNFVLRSSQMHTPPRPEFDYPAESALFEEIMKTFTWETSPQSTVDLEGQIAFVGQDGQVYLLRNGNSPIRVTNDLSGPMRQVGFSQSGRWLSFINRDNNLYVINTSSTNFHHIQLGGNINSYDWAGLSDTIAYTSNSFLVIQDPSNLVKHETNIPAYSVSWSPDDNKLAVVRTQECPANVEVARGSNSQILLYDADGANERKVYETNHLSTIWHVEWSGGGGYLFYEINPCLEVGIFGDARAIDLSGNEINDGFDLRFWSKEDKFISAKSVSQIDSWAYDSDIYQSRPGSNHYERIYYRAGNTSLPITLSPDGKYLVFGSGQAVESYSGLGYDEPAYWLIQTDGSNANQIAGQDFKFVIWSPSGGQMLYATSSASFVYSISSKAQTHITDVIQERRLYDYIYDVAWGNLPNPQLPPPSTNICPYSSLFQEKKEIIDYLENPPLSVLEYNTLIPLPFTGERRGYDESRSKSIIKVMEVECEYYATGKLSTEDMRVFENRIPAFKRLIYTEKGVQQLLPSVAQLQYDFSKHTVESAAIIYGLVSSIMGFTDLIKSVVPSFLENAIVKLERKSLYWLVDSLQKICEISAGNKELRDACEVGLLIVKTQIDSKKAIFEVIKDLGIKRIFFEKLMSLVFLDNSQFIRAAESVYPEMRIVSPLEVKGTDEDAYAAVQKVVKTEIARADASHRRAGIFDTVSQIGQIASDLTKILEESLSFTPMELVKGLSEILRKIYQTIDLVSFFLTSFASIDTGYTALIVRDRMHEMDKVAFDPSAINSIYGSTGSQPSHQVSIDYLLPGKNQTPAHVYYSGNERRFYSSIDDYEQKIQELLFILENGTDEQVATAINQFVDADDEVARMIRLTEKPILGSYHEYPQIREFVDSSQQFSLSNSKFLIGLLFLVADRSNTDVLQQVEVAAQEAVARSNHLQDQYALLQQPSFDLSITPSVVITKYEIPDTIIFNEPAIIKITVTNPTTMPFIGRLSIRGGDVLSGSESPLAEIPPGQEKIFEMKLQPIRSGKEILFMDLVQEENVIDSMVAIVKVKSTAGISPYWIAGGAGLLCLLGFFVGGVAYYTKRKAPSRTGKVTLAPKKVQQVNHIDRMNQAVEFARAERYPEAFAIFKEIVRSDPGNRSAWFNMGLVLMKMKNFKDAEFCLMQASKLGHEKADEALNWLRKNKDTRKK